VNVSSRSRSSLVAATLHRDATSAMNCSLCGAEVSFTSEQNPITWVCSRCGEPGAGIGDPPPPLLSPENLVEFEVSVTWKNGSPSLDELAAMRRLVPEFANMPPSRVRERLSTGAGRYVLGRQPKYLVVELVELIASHGLIATLEPTGNLLRENAIPEPLLLRWASSK